MNAFLRDAAYNLGRAATLLDREMTKAQIEDTTIQFAFGVERLFKGIVTNVNPVFVLESGSFDNAVAVLYREKLIPKHREKADKEAEKPKSVNARLLPFQGSMLRAAKFSKTTEKYIGTLTKLSDYRGVIAHRTLDQFAHDEVQNFTLRVFYPLVSEFANELALKTDECMASKTEQLARISEQMVKQENFEQSFNELIAQHQEVWDKKSGDDAYVTTTFKQTTSELVNGPDADKFAEEYQCPACDNPALLFIDADWDVEGSRGEAFLTGVYVSGLECRFCGLELNDYEEFDYLKPGLFTSGVDDGWNHCVMLCV